MLKKIIKNKWIVILLCFFLSLQTIEGVKDLYKIISVSLNGQKTTGIITDRVVRARGLLSSCRTTSYGSIQEYTVEFKTMDNKLIRAKQNFCVFPNYNPQDKVNLVYSKANPTIMSLEYGLSGTWIGGIFNTIIGGISLAVVIDLLKKEFKKWKKFKKR